MKNTNTKWLIYSAISMFIAIVLFIMSQTILKDVVVHRQLQDTDSAYLSFNTNYAEVDSPLTVFIHNADYSADQVTYTWSVDGQTVYGNNSDTYIPTSSDLENFISVKVTYGDNETLSASLYCSKLPVIYIDTDNTSIGSSSTQAYITVQSSPTYAAEDMDFYYGAATVKIDAYTDFTTDKYPYSITLDNSCDLFNMGSGKNWLLLSGDTDPTLLRSKLMYDIADGLGMTDTTQMVHVALIHNGSYEGIYLLCEPTEIDDEQVNVYDWESLAKEAAALIIAIKKQTSIISDATADFMEEELTYSLLKDMSWLSSPYTFTYQSETYDMRKYVDIPALTGGFLLKLDGDADTSWVKSPLTTNYDQPLLVSIPEYASTNDEFYDYIYKYIQTFEYALHSDDFIYHDNEKHYMGHGMYYDWNTGWIGRRTLIKYVDTSRDGIHYSQLFDMDSLVNNWLMCELSMNYKSMYEDLYIAKDIDELAYICTLQDFYSALGNTSITDIETYFPNAWHTTLNYFTIDNYYQSEQWNRYLIKDPYFLLQVYDKYKAIRTTLLEDMFKDGGLLDTYEASLYEAAIADNARWGTSDSTQAMTSLQAFIETRLSWLDKQFASFDTLVDSLGYYKPSSDIAVTSIVANHNGSYMIVATTTNSYATEISFQVNGTQMYTAKVVNGVASIVTDNLSDDDTNIVVLRGVNNSGDYLTGVTNYKLFGGEYSNE